MQFNQMFSQELDQLSNDLLNKNCIHKMVAICANKSQTWGQISGRYRDPGSAFPHESNLLQLSSNLSLQRGHKLSSSPESPVFIIALFILFFSKESKIQWIHVDNKNGKSKKECFFLEIYSILTCLISKQSAPVSKLFYNKQILQ